MAIWQSCPKPRASPWLRILTEVTQVTLATPGPNRPGLGFARALVVLVTLLGFTLLPLTARADTVQDLPVAGSALVKQVLSADTLLLADGRVVRLAGIQGPRPGHGRAHAWPLAAEAKAALDRLVLGRTVTLRAAAFRQDRHDRWVAHLVRDDGLWLEGELLGLGWARVYVASDLKTLGPEMYAQERAAREAQRGLWANRFYAVRSPDGLEHDGDSFQVVEGRVLAVAMARGQIFLDFGPDWRTDFTVFIPRRAAKPFRLAFGDPRQLQGQMVRVRGWVFRHNGPEIELTVPEQLEKVEPAQAPPP